MASAPGAAGILVLWAELILCLTYIIHETTIITISVIQDRHAHHVSIPVMRVMTSLSRTVWLF